MLRCAPAHTYKHTQHRAVMTIIVPSVISELGLLRADGYKSTVAPPSVSAVASSYELGGEFRVNLKYPNPKINYAYPKEQV